MKVNSAEELGKFIRNRRKKLKYTQAYISEASGLSVSFISDVENGKPTVEIEKVILLANLLGMDLFLEER